VMVIIGLVGLVTLDINIVGSVTREGVGGSIFYISQALDVLGIEYRALTAVGEDFPLSSLDSRTGDFLIRNYRGSSLLFKNMYGGGSRKQRVENYGYRFDLEDILEIFCNLYVDILGIVPVLGEVSIEDILSLSGYFDVGVDPQGVIREVINGSVVGRHISPNYFMKTKILKVSGDEISYIFPNIDKLMSFVDVYRGGLAVTLGVNGSVIFYNDSIFHVPSIPIYGDVDTTGAGDVYMAGLLYGYVSGMDFLDSAVLATALSYTLISEGVTSLDKFSKYINRIRNGIVRLDEDSLIDYISFL